MIVKRNWRNVYPNIAHKSGLDWRLLAMDTKTSGDIDTDIDPMFKCLQSITYVSLARLQPSLSYKRHIHEDHEELYYIIKGKGIIKIDDDITNFQDGDILYIPAKTEHTIMNDGEEMIEFLAFGGLTVKR